IEAYIGTNVWFVAADGGANRAVSLNLVPDVVIGDLDSFDKVGFPYPEAEVVHKPDQDTNDLEKALSLCLERQIREVLVFGATNMRLDHTWKNLSVMLQFHARFDR
ncbi:thiamine diphosphokinase, partial [Arthrospira platensis SPKY1]|nr:thiamine diphosphokinase [Arthrospira platensis SPKY1]